MQKSPLFPSNQVHSSNNQNPPAMQRTSHVYYIELKNDPGVLRLTNIKVRSAEVQRRRSVCAFRPSCLHFPIINTISPRRGTSPSQSPPHVPPHEDATMASESTLSTLAQLAASASANDLVPAPSESTPVTTKTKEQLRRHDVRMLHNVVD